MAIIAQDTYTYYMGLAVPVILALIAWAIHNFTHGLLAAWAIHLVILLTWALVLSTITRRSSSESRNDIPIVDDLEYEVLDVSYDTVQGYLEDDCPRTRCLHDIWKDRKPGLTEDSPPSDYDEEKPPSIWDGKADFSCTSSEADLLPRDSITQHGIMGWHIRMIMTHKAKYQRQRLENLVKKNELQSEFPRFQDWPRDPSLSYKQNWDGWYDARQQHQRLHLLSDEKMAEERRKRERQAGKVEKWWYEKKGVSRSQSSLPKVKPHSPVRIRVLDEQAMKERVIFELNEPGWFDDTWRRIEDNYQKQVVDKGFLWPHWRPRSGSAEPAEETLPDEGERFDGLWDDLTNRQDRHNQCWMEDDFETY